MTKFAVKALMIDIHMKRLTPLIPHQVMTAAAHHRQADIKVWSTDTDVLILLLDLVSRERLQPENNLYFLTGRGMK